MSKLKQKIPTLFGILTTLLFAVLAGLGVIIYGHWTIKSQIDQDSDSLDWNIYRNENLGFSIGYPLDWIVKEDASKGEVVFGQENEIDLSKIFRAGFSIKMYPGQQDLPGNQIKNLSLNEWIADIFFPLEGGETKELINMGIENYPAVLVKKINVLEIEKLTFVYVQSGKTIYEIRGGDDEAIFREMLATLKLFRFGGPVQLARLIREV